MENKAVKIVRFKDGLDVVCFFEQKENNFELTNPMLFEVRNANLQMMQWIPMGVVKNDMISIDKDNILCSFEPTDDFKEYFITVTEKLFAPEEESSKKKRKKEEIKEILDAISELESVKGTSIH